MRGVTISVIIFYGIFVISTHTPHARRDERGHFNFRQFRPFQLTRLMRGVTFIQLPPYYTYNISTHTPHARRDRYRHHMGERH